MIPIAIVDDKRDIVDNLKTIFNLFDNINVLFVAHDGEEIVQQLSHQSVLPKVILMDIEMRKMNGIQATQIIKKQHSEIKILMMTIFDQEEKIFESIQAGADGYLVKDERPSKIVEAIENVLEGRIPMSPIIAHKTLAFLRAPLTLLPSKSPNDYNLTKREIQILELISEGKSYKTIGQELFISHKTVSSHIEKIYRKLEVNSKIGASKIANKHHWFKR